MLEEKRNRIRLDIIKLLWPRHDVLDDRYGNQTLRWVYMLQANGLLPNNVVSSDLTRIIIRIQNACKPDALMACGVAITPQSRLRFLVQLNELTKSAGICLESLGNRTGRNTILSKVPWQSWLCVLIIVIAFVYPYFQ